MSRRVGRPVDSSGGKGLVAAVRGTLVAHMPADRREAGARGQVLDALARLERPFDQGADPEHVTGSAIVVGPRGTVLHLHKRLHRWLQPGGHVEPGEGPWDAAWRESQEETGLVLAHPPSGPRLIHVDVHGAPQGHTHLDLRYLLLAPDRDPAPPPGESPEALWFGWDEACTVADEALVGALRTARLQPEVRGGCGPVPSEVRPGPSPGACGGGRAPRHNGGDGTT